jgi:hypothetical protein
MLFEWLWAGAECCWKIKSRLSSYPFDFIAALAFGRTIALGLGGS